MRPSISIAAAIALGLSAVPGADPGERPAGEAPAPGPSAVERLGPVSAQEAEVLAAVERMFEGMRTADSAVVREVLAEGARFALLDDREGENRLVFMPVDGWVEAIAGSGGRWDERIYDVEIEVDRNMASAWTPYTFYLDGAVRHCGVNSIELLRTATGWKVTQLSDTRSTSDCPDPLGG